MKYTYVTLIRDPYIDDDGFTSYTGEYLDDQNLVLFNTKDEAFNSAVKAANEELITLNSNADPDEYFSILEDDLYKTSNQVIINHYFHYSDEVQLVTRRRILVVS